MCSDLCGADANCRGGPVAGLTCVFSKPALPGWCEPPDAGLTNCAPAASFQGGHRPLGACCEVHADITTGSSCASGVCTATGDGPFVCSQICDASRECPAGYGCDLLEGTDAPTACYPLASQYTCN
jgi:hypothetical protein